MPDILVTENINGEEMDALKREFSVTHDSELWRNAEKVHQLVAAHRALVVRNQTKVHAKLIAAAPQLEIIARAGVGLDNVDTAAASAAGIVISYTPDQNSISVAELTVGLMLALARQIPAADRSTRSGKWERQRFMGTELYEKTVGIVGFGRIGRLTAERVRAFGAKVLVYDVQPVTDAPSASLDELLSRADIVSI